MLTDDEILSELGFVNADEDMRDRVVGNIRTIVELRVRRVAIERMTKKQARTFADLEKSGDNQAIWDWLWSDIAGLAEVYEAVLKDLIEDRKANEFSP